MNKKIESFNPAKPIIRLTKNIIFKGKEYPIDFSLLKKYSNYFYNKKTHFKSINNIFIQFDDHDICEESIPIFIACCHNEPFQITDKTAFSLHQLSIRYEVPELQKLTEEYIKTNQKNQLFQSILSKISENPENEETIALQFIENIDNEQLLSLPIPVLYRILNNYSLDFNSLNSNDQNRLIDFLFRILSKRGKEASVLFANIEFTKERIELISRLLNEYSGIFDFNMLNPKFLMKTIKELLGEVTKLKTNFSNKFSFVNELIESKKEMEIEIQKRDKLIDQLNTEKVDLTLLINDIKNQNENDKKIQLKINQLSESFRSNLQEKKEIEFKLQKGKEFNGIMRYLSKKSKSNIHDNRTIKILSNSISNGNLQFHPKNLVDYQNNNYYKSKNEIGGIILFDFMDKQINLSNYSIKSYSSGKNFAHLRNWVVEVSNDGNEWLEIDRHLNDSTLNGSNIVAVFDIKDHHNEYYRFVQFRQTGYSWCDYPYSNSYYVYLYFIEFFGKIKFS
ncbi:hypothetical protein M9Y10_029810 [Tritrichomonas musculus]|uniref:BTB domain-containing protein n=1 Tax=Tritrichomonas musculus TaxID=1915356 RepID=A0ABR2KNL1_9EUKA